MSMPAYSPSRIVLARHRRGHTIGALAEKAGVSSKWLSAVEHGLEEASEATLQKLALALGFPVAFFHGDHVDPMTKPARSSTVRATVSFRAAYSLRERDKDRAVASAHLAEMIDAHLRTRFRLPEAQIPDLRSDDRLAVTPEAAADLVRRDWGLSDRPVPNMLHLLESRGIRVFWLSTDVSPIDAFSFRRAAPVIILNKNKSGERSRFDAAHELGHLVLHREGDLVGEAAEQQADRFAAAFLFPDARARAELPRAPILDHFLALKPRWRVSAAAMLKRGSDLGLYSAWQARSAWIEMSKRGWRRGEPAPVDHEESQVFAKIAELMATKGQCLDQIAADLNLPSEDFAQLVPLHTLKASVAARPRRAPPAATRPSHLRLVRSDDDA